MDSTRMESNHVAHEHSIILGCQKIIPLDLFLHLCLIPAVFIIVVLSFLQKRAHSLAIDRRLPFLGGRFGIVVPLDTVGSISNRWSYGFAFGAVSGGVLLLFSGRYIPFTVPNWAHAIVYLVGALEVGLVYFPFFACLSTPVRVAGGLLGIFYSLSWIIVTVLNMFTCPDNQILDRYEQLIFQWPCILSLIFLLGRFIYILVKGVRIQLKFEQEDPEELNEQHQVQHVQGLLRKPPAHSKPLSWFQRRVYEWDPHFKFPNRIIGTAIITLICLYTVTVQEYIFTSKSLRQLEKSIDTWQQVVSSNMTNPLGALLTQLEEFIVVAQKCWLSSTIFASLNSVLYTFHVLACYRKHLQRLWRGQRGFLPEKFHKPSSAVSVASIARYSGWQIAFTLWGFAIVHSVSFLLALLVAYVVVIPIQSGRLLIILTDLGFYVLPISLVFSLVILQVALVQTFFLQEKISPTDKAKPLALNNRKGFHCFNYFFFFYNVAMGFSTCILRLLCSIVLGTWLVSRIDRTIMQRGYESLDSGYATWIGMIFADHYHNNPVMVCFCQLLVSNKLERHRASAYAIFNNVPSEPPANSKARRRWMLIYTLLRNPHLIPLRKQHLSSSSSPDMACPQGLTNACRSSGVTARGHSHTSRGLKHFPRVLLL